jgi:hypothetical protein
MGRQRVSEIGKCYHAAQLRDSHRSCTRMALGFSPIIYFIGGPAGLVEHLLKDVTVAGFYDGIL